MRSRVDPVWSPTCTMFSHCLRMEREIEALVLGLWVVLRNIPPEGACIKPLEQIKDWRWIERPRAWQLNGSSVSQHQCPHCIAQFNSHSHMFIAFASGDGERVGREWGEGTSRRGQRDPVMEMRRPNGCLRNWKQIWFQLLPKRGAERTRQTVWGNKLLSILWDSFKHVLILKRGPPPPPPALSSAPPYPKGHCSWPSAWLQGHLSLMEGVGCSYTTAQERVWLGSWACPTATQQYWELGHFA